MSKRKKRPAKKQRGKKRHPALYLAAALATVVAGYALWVWLRVVPEDNPADLLPDVLVEQEFTLNAGLTDLYQPGNIVQVTKEGPDGGERPLAAPLLLLEAQQCFPDLEIKTSPFALPSEIRSDAGASLAIGWKGLAKFLPELDLGNTTQGRYRLELDAPRLLATKKPDMSGRFSAECVERLNHARTSGDPTEWLRVVDQAVVTDGLRLEVETSSASSAETQLAVENALSGSGDVEVGTEGTTKTVYKLGPTVLAYKTRPMEPFEFEAEPEAVEEPSADAGPAISGRLAVIHVDGRASRRVGTDHTFRTGDWFRFGITSDVGGWLYVFHRPPGGELELIWPPREGGANELPAGLEVEVPPRPQGWQFTETTGEEYFYVAITSEPRIPGTDAPKVEAPAKVVNYIVRGLARNVELGVVPEDGTALETIELTPTGDSRSVAAVELVLHHGG